MMNFMAMAGQDSLGTDLEATRLIAVVKPVFAARVGNFGWLGPVVVDGETTELYQALMQAAPAQRTEEVINLAAMTGFAGKHA